MVSRPEAHGGRRMRWLAAIAGVAVATLFFATPAMAQGNDDCLMCHEDPELVGERHGVEIPVFIDPELFSSSVHADFGCIDCHMDLDGVELPHEEELEAIDCAMCHDDVAEELAAGPHGAWAEDPGAPAAKCIICHGAHNVLSPGDPAAPVSSARSEELCGRCHARELRQVAKSPHARSAENGPVVTPRNHRRVSRRRSRSAEPATCGKRPSTGGACTGGRRPRVTSWRRAA